MKPFITDAFRHGRYVLEYQIENTTSWSMRDGVVGASIVSLSIPQGHSYRAAWIVRLLFDNGLRIDFSSASTGVGGWREIGSLNISICSDASAEPIDSLDLEVRQILDFKVSHVETLVHEEPDLLVENGIIFTSVHGDEIWIAAGPAPGSVSVRSPWTNDFQPEFEVWDCKRIRM
jgi:hypothetical protein